MRTVIEVFNQLTHTELADCNTFQNILNNHYNKFKMIYKHIKHLDIDDIYKITCVDSDSGLIVCIIPTRPEILIEFVEDVDNDYNFDVNFSYNDGKLIMQIFDSDMSEVDIYESRFGIHKKGNRHK